MWSVVPYGSRVSVPERTLGERWRNEQPSGTGEFEEKEGRTEGGSSVISKLRRWK